MWARTSALVSSQLLISSPLSNSLVGLVGRREHSRMRAVPGVVIGDVREVSDPAVEAEQVERGSAEEQDRHVVGAEEVAHLGDVLQPPPRLPATGSERRIGADTDLRAVSASSFADRRVGLPALEGRRFSRRRLGARRLGGRRLGGPRLLGDRLGGRRLRRRRLGCRRLLGGRLGGAFRGCRSAAGCLRGRFRRPSRSNRAITHGAHLALVG